MAAKRVVVVLTEAQADAMEQLANYGYICCEQDGPGSLGLTGSQWAAGQRAVEALHDARVAATAEKVIRMTDAEAMAVWSLADQTIAGETDEMHPATVSAGARGMRKL